MKNISKKLLLKAIKFREDLLDQKDEKDFQRIMKRRAEKYSPEFILKNHACELNQDYNNVCVICGKIVSTNYH